MPQILAIVAIALYLLTTFLIYRYRDTRDTTRHLPPLLSWGLTLVVHSIALAQVLHTPQGLDLSLTNALSMVAWICSAILLAAALRVPVTSIGLIVLPFSALMLAGTLLPLSENDTIIRAEHGLKIHILTSLLAYSLLTLAAIQAGLLAYQDYHLRTHQLRGWVGKLPPLQHMETLLFQVIWAGFGLLTLSLLSGFVFLDDLFAQHLVHKTVLAIAAWFIFGTLLTGRVLAGWRGRKAIRWTLTGFAFLMLAYFGSKLVLEFFITPA